MVGVSDDNSPPKVFAWVFHSPKIFSQPPGWHCSGCGGNLTSPEYSQLLCSPGTSSQGKPTVSVMGRAELNCSVSSQCSNNSARKQAPRGWTVLSWVSWVLPLSADTDSPSQLLQQSPGWDHCQAANSEGTRRGAQISEWAGYSAAANTVQHCSAEATEETFFSAGHCESVHIFTSVTVSLSQSFPLLFSLFPLPSYCNAFLKQDFSVN